MDKKDKIILQQLDVIRSMTENNMKRMNSDFWGTPFENVTGSAPKSPAPTGSSSNGGSAPAPEKKAPLTATAKPGDEKPGEEELPPPESEELEQAHEAIPVEGEALQRLEEKLRFSYPYPADTVTPRRMAVSELAERAAREHYLLKRRPKCLTRQEATAAERGNAAHRAMQFADLAALKKDPKAEIERLVAEGYLYREDGALIDTRVLEKLMSSPLGERMRKADRVEREMRFLQEFTPEELAAIDPALRVPGTTLIMGAVDAVLVEGDHAVLLDYKTDRVAAPQELTGRYALQLKLYAAMVRRQFGLPVTEAVLYSFCLGQAVKVEL